MYDPKGHRCHDPRGNTDAQENRGHRLLQPHVQHCSHQRPGPGACARKRDCHQEAEADGAVFFHHPALGMGLLLKSCDQTVQLCEVLSEPGENVADVDDDEWDGDHVAEDCRGQGKGIWEAKGYSIGKTAAEFDYGEHGDKEGGYIFPHDSLKH